MSRPAPGPSEYQCKVDVVVFPGDSVTIPITLHGEGMSDEQYAEVCHHLQRTVQNAITEGRREITTLLDQCLAIGHYATAPKGITRKNWKATSRTIADVSADHVAQFFLLKVDGAISEGMSWAVLRFDVIPTYADVIGSRIQEEAGSRLRKRRTRSGSERRRPPLDVVVASTDIAAAVARIAESILAVSRG